MLNFAQRLTFPELPHVLIYADHEAVTRFYAVPELPRIAIDEHAKPLISLLLYGRKQNGKVQPSGGQVMLTTSLMLTAQERDLLECCLTAWLSMQIPEVTESPEILTPEWLDGAVTVTLTPNLHLSGKPSLMGANECALNLSFNAEDAQKVQQAWSQSLPDSQIQYQVKLAGVEQSQQSTQSQSTTSEYQPGYTATDHQHRQLHVRKTEVTSDQLTLKGAISLSLNVLNQQLQIIKL